jgi:hypothetical protein
LTCYVYFKVKGIWLTMFSLRSLYEVKDIWYAMSSLRSRTFDMLCFLWGHCMKSGSFDMLCFLWGHLTCYVFLVWGQGHLTHYCPRSRTFDMLCILGLERVKVFVMTGNVSRSQLKKVIVVQIFQYLHEILYSLAKLTWTMVSKLKKCCILNYRLNKVLRASQWHLLFCKIVRNM